VVMLLSPKIINLKGCWFYKSLSNSVRIRATQKSPKALMLLLLIY
jgi:hypothetical protein